MSKKQKPSEQSFNVAARHNQTKKNSWWNGASSTYWAKKKKG